jgi:hypothetical protein
MTEHKSAIVYISTDFLSGIPRLKEAVKSLESIGILTKVSTIYKRFRSHRSEDLNSTIVMATRWKLNVSESEVFDEIELAIQRENWSGSTDIFFLAASDVVRLVPGENLPHPLLHTDSLVLRCAAEVYGEYLHPILDQNLAELVLCSDPVRDAEFFNQGKSFSI